MAAPGPLAPIESGGPSAPIGVVSRVDTTKALKHKEHYANPMAKAILKEKSKVPSAQTQVVPVQTEELKKPKKKLPPSPRGRTVSQPSQVTTDTRVTSAQEIDKIYLKKCLEKIDTLPPQERKSMLLNERVLTACAMHMAPDELKTLLSKLGDTDLRNEFVSKLSEKLIAPCARGESEQMNHAISLLKAIVDELPPEEVHAHVRGNLGSALRAYMVRDIDKFSEMVKVLEDKAGGLFRELATSTPKQDAVSDTKAVSFSVIDPARLMSLVQHLDDRIKFIEENYKSKDYRGLEYVDKEGAIEIAALKNLRHKFLYNPEEVINDIKANFDKPLFKELGELFFLSSLYLVDENIAKSKAAGKSVPEKVEKMESSKKVALVAYSTGYYNGINRAFRQEDEKIRNQDFNAGMKGFMARRKIVLPLPDESNEAFKARQAKVQTQFREQHFVEVPEKTVKTLLQLVDEALKELPDISAIDDKGQKIELNRIIFTPVPDPWEEKSFKELPQEYKDKIAQTKPEEWDQETLDAIEKHCFIDRGVMSVSAGGVAASGWRALKYENSSPDTPVWKNAKNLMLFSLFGSDENEVVFLPGTKFICMRGYEKDRQGAKIYVLKLT